MKRKTDKINNYVAIGLEQLLIWILISSLLILILFQTYALIKKQALKLECKTATLYNQIIADFFLRNKIEQFGYKGLVASVPIAEYSTISNPNAEIIIPKAPIAVCKATVTNFRHFVTNNILQKIINHKIKANTDVLLVYDVPDKVTYLSADMHSNHSPLIVAAKSDVFTIGDQMMIADFQCIQRFIVSNIVGTQMLHGKPFNSSNNFAKVFTTGTEVFRTKQMAFYIAKNDRHIEDQHMKDFNNKKQTTYSLYMEDLNAKYSAEAILDNIDNFLVETIDVNSKKLVDASKFGWIFNKYIVINLLFKDGLTEKSFITGFIIRNNA